MYSVVAAVVNCVGIVIPRKPGPLSTCPVSETVCCETLACEDGSGYSQFRKLCCIKSRVPTYQKPRLVSQFVGKLAENHRRHFDQKINNTSYEKQTLKISTVQTKELQAPLTAMYMHQPSGVHVLSSADTDKL